ncbi:MAG: DUF4255 domain-containing protein [Gammaproteobacteria bacterium]|nr:DUF4255 domain-containing protein [Gammaproteobacteria bacterium]NIR58153.1 DUF4255 domain-containing protein [Gammaproteobacteria bacterium]NIR88149.1 DUF4255 domain-containing protein [Gammaproteobacteria bacterium]
MALTDSGRAIGAVTKLLQDHLIRRGFAVTVGKPEEAAQNDTQAKLNLFLYQTDFDGSLRNVSLDEQRPSPLWLCLKYLVTAFDDDESSDTADAHELLGRALSALHELNFLSLDSLTAVDVRHALENSPEPLKITFDETPAELLSSIMQGTDEKYRLSVAFQVRPVMIVPAEPPSYALLVGVDYTQAPPAIIGEDGVGLGVLASLGAVLEELEPQRFEPGQELEIRGEDLHLGGLECWLGPVQLSVVAQRPDRMTVRAESAIPFGATEGPIAAGGVIAAGEHPLSLRQLMPNGRYRASNLLVAQLLPVVDGVALAAGDLQITGLLLGRAEDDVLVALYRDGRVARVFDSAATGADQKSLTVAGAAADTAAGQYLVIVRVNGQQARRSPGVIFP